MYFLRNRIRAFISRAYFRTLDLVFGILLRKFGFIRARAMITSFAAMVPSRAPINVSHLSEYASYCAHVLAQRSCLRRSLVIYFIALTKKRDARLITGMQRDELGYRFHSWVEVQSIVLGDQTNVRVEYKTLWNV